MEPLPCPALMIKAGGFNGWIIDVVAGGWHGLIGCSPFIA